jgi:hypothetical protein
MARVAGGLLIACGITLSIAEIFALERQLAVRGTLLDAATATLVLVCVCRFNGSSGI